MEGGRFSREAGQLSGSLKLCRAGIASSKHPRVGAGRGAEAHERKTDTFGWMSKTGEVKTSKGNIMRGAAISNG